jgi:biopolymer transport protein ExbD
MAHRTASPLDGEAALAEISMVPLIDGMLVLLVIFIVAAPLLTHAVKVDLPQAASQPSPPLPDEVQLGIGRDGALSWNGEATDIEGLSTRLATLAQRDPTAELRIHADRQTPYEFIAKAMGLAARQGISRIGFVSLPEMGKW